MRATRRVRLWYVALAASAWLVLAPRPAMAHVKWFTDPALHGLVWDAATRAALVTGLAAGLLATAGSWLVERVLGPLVRAPAWLAADGQREQRLLEFTPVLLRLHAAVPLFVAAVQMYLLSPHLELPRSGLGGLVALAQLLVALSLVYGALLRPAAAALSGLVLLGGLRFGAAFIAEHAHFLGILACLRILGPGTLSLDRWLGWSRDHGRVPVRAALRWLRLGMGLSLMASALTEKLLAPQAAVSFLHGQPSFNALASVGFPVSDAQFARIAGYVELSAGLALAAGWAIRPLILFVWLPMNLSLPFMGWMELVGHLPYYGGMAALLLWGRGPEHAALRSGHGQGLQVAPLPSGQGVLST